MLQNEPEYYISPEREAVHPTSKVHFINFRYDNMRNAKFLFSELFFCFGLLPIWASTTVERGTVTVAVGGRKKKVSHLVDMRHGGQRIYKKKTNQNGRSKEKGGKNSATWWIQPQVMIFTLSCWTFTLRSCQACCGPLLVKGEKQRQMHERGVLEKYK